MNTGYYIGAFAVIAIVYDIYAVWKYGSEGTISWIMLTWWSVHPFVISAVFILIGHLFFPKCGLDIDVTESIDSALGTIIGIVASFLIVYEVYERWDKALNPVIKFDRSYLFRQIVLAAAGMMIGHLFFPQYVECQSDAGRTQSEVYPAMCTAWPNPVQDLGYGSRVRENPG